MILQDRYILASCQFAKLSCISAVGSSQQKPTQPLLVRNHISSLSLVVSELETQRYFAAGYGLDTR